jgi:hypothetical protein
VPFLEPVCRGRRASLSGPVVLGLLPALALACVLVGNWAAGRTPVEMLQMRGGELLVDLEPNQPMRVVGELEPVFETPSAGLMGMGMGQMLRTRFCGSECRQNMGICMKPPRESPGVVECKSMLTSCQDKCKAPSWEQKLLPCWDAVRECLHACAGPPPRPPRSLPFSRRRAHPACMSAGRAAGRTRQAVTARVRVHGQARDNYNNCAARSGNDPFCKKLFVDSVAKC